MPATEAQTASALHRISRRRRVRQAAGSGLFGATAGRGFFGGQKLLFRSYYARVTDTLWNEGADFKSWPRTIASLGNVYQSRGYP